MVEEIKEKKYTLIGVEDATTYQSKEINQSYAENNQTLASNMSTPESTFYFSDESKTITSVKGGRSTFSEPPTPSPTKTTSVSSKSSEPTQSFSPISTQQGTGRIIATQTPTATSQAFQPQAPHMTTPGQKESVMPSTPQSLPEDNRILMSDVFREQGVQAYERTKDYAAATNQALTRGDISSAVTGAVQTTASLTQTAVFGVSQAGTSIGEGMAAFVSNPTEYIGRGVETTVALVTNRENRRVAAQEIVGRFQTNPVGQFVATSTDVLAPSVIPKAVKGLRGAYVRLGSTEVPTTDFFPEGVLRGDQQLVYAGSTQEALRAFRTGDDFVELQHSSPAPITNTVSGVGKKAATGIEDPGIYVSPRGQGMTYFLRLNNQPVPYEQVRVTLNPFEGLAATRPTITVFRAQGVDLYPRAVVNKPGFTAVREFQQSQKGSGRAFITKRSELGQGTVPQQVFTPERLSPEGDVIGTRAPRLEKGTTELEAVIPLGTRFTYEPKTFFGRLKGFDEYTVVDGTPVAIRRATLEVEDVYPGRVREGVDVPSERIVRESAELSRVGESTRVVSPRVVAPSISAGSDASSLSESVSSPSRVASGSSRVSGVPSGSRVGSSEVVRPTEPRTTSYRAPTRPTSYRSPTRRTSQTYYPYYPSSPRTPRTPGFTRSTTIRPFRKQGESQFAVFVRRFGDFSRVGTTKTLGEASRIGSYNVGTSAAASFYVQDIATGQRVNPNLGKDFYLSAREPGVAIERRSRRIKSGGELRDITYKGIQARRNRL